jgi:predicted phage terminase large subunit-like protein
MRVYLGIDPSPPKDEEPEKRKTKDPDPEVLSAVGVLNDKVFLLESVVIQDPNPERTAIEFTRMVAKFGIKECYVETVAYQRTIEWYLKRHMKKTGIYATIHCVDDKRSKVKRIRQVFTELCPENRFYVHASMKTFMDQYQDYPDVTHDDVLDSVAIPISQLMKVGLISAKKGEKTIDAINEDQYEDLSDWRAAP